jgi:predicted MPP superfamily phosphohydrolase
MVKVLIWLIPVCNILWFAWAWWRAGRLTNARRWRAFATAFFAFMMLHLAWLFYSRASNDTIPLLAPSLSMAYVWHLLVVIPLLLVIVAGEFSYLAVGPIRKAWAGKGPEEIFDGSRLPDVPDGASRRDFLRATAIAAPPALTIITGLAGYAESLQFRVRRMDVDVPGLPKELDGTTIAHVSDVHAGKFVDEKLMARIAEVTNDLRADVILATGDLIDFSLADLPAALDAVRKLDSPGGVYMCEGNHDLFQSRKIFDDSVRAAKVGLLINQTETVRVRGHDVQLIGLRWGLGAGAHDPHPPRSETGDGKWQPRHDDAGASVHLEGLRDQFDPGAFPIVLAHHPHAFDAAAGLGLPLPLAGHTHGGQLMLTQNIGAGPLMYRYWSGLYRKGNSRLVVSNGVGNWLPLRINAPAEVVHITLRTSRG